MYNTKYVIVEGCAIVFSAALTHKDMVGYGQKVDGAGFVRFDTKIDSYGETIIVAKAYGRSVSLNIDSREEDSDIITHQISNPF